MRRAVVVLVAALLAGCADKPAAERAAPAASVGPSPIQVPRALRSCPLPPAAPPAPRTVEQLGAYALALEANRAECAERLRRVVDLIDARQ